MSGARSNFKVYTGTGALQNVVLPANASYIKIIKIGDGQEGTKMESMPGTQYLLRIVAGDASLPAAATTGITFTRDDGSLTVALGAACVMNTVSLKYHLQWFE